MDHMDRQEQYIQLGRPSSLGSSANATPTIMQPNDGGRSVQICPSLYLAAYKGRVEEVMALLLQQHGVKADFRATGIIMHGQCDILEVTAERNTVLHVSAEQGHDELIRELHLRFREQVLLSRRNSALDTPLHCAARAGHVRAVAVLVQLAEDCNESILGCKNEAGDTALHLAARHGHCTVVEALVSAAAGPAVELNNTGVSPLYLAVMSGSVRAVRAITTCNNASPIGPSSQNALHAAVFQSSEMVRLLLDWNPALADQVDINGSSPLHFASSVGDRAIVRAILSTAPPRTLYRKDSCGGLSALHVAARMGHRRVVEEMLRTCPDAAELRDDDGGTFLHAAAREKKSKVLSLAVKVPRLRGLLDAQDRDGNTPLHLAVAAGAPDVVEALLRNGKVRADVLNKDGHTAFDLAAESTSFFTMVSLVVTLVAYGSRSQPQRQDHLKQWSSSNMVQGIEKTSDSLAVVAGLVATAAFAAGFNVPGGYNDTTGEANLADKRSFKTFLLLDMFAAATSIVAVILLVYGKVSRSAVSWMTFPVALLFMWVSLISLMLAFYTALVAVVSSRAVYHYGFGAIYFCITLLYLYITWRIRPPNTSTIWRFLWQWIIHPKGRHVIMKRRYPLVDAYLLYFFLFTVMNFIVSSIFGWIFTLRE